MFQSTIFLALFASVAAAATCNTPAYGSCGSDAGITCCPSDQYCQPWDSGYYQCINPPAQCSQQLTNIDFYGDDIKTIYGVQPDVCCTQCAQTAGCKAYTFVNSNPGQPACYLKSGTSQQRTSIGAVSGILNGGSTPTSTPTPTPTPTLTPTQTPKSTPIPSSGCSTSAFGSCGSSSGTTCCPSDQYCQPWNPTYYQCIARPAQCTAQETDTDYHGNDLQTVYVNLPSLCCEACAKLSGCKAYTYINSNPGQPVCYLKSAAGPANKLIGAVSGKLN